MTVATGLRPRMDIEAALRWAFRDELPKTGALNRSEIDTPRHVGLPKRDRDVLTTTVQQLIGMEANCFGVLQQVGAGRSPHPDAIAIGDAVMALDEASITVPDDWKPLAEMDDLSPEVTRLLRAAVAKVAREINGDKRLFGMRPSYLVRRSALSGVAPNWRAEVPVVKIETHPNGVVRWFVARAVRSKAWGEGREAIEYVEEDGFDKVARRPKPGAYQKPILHPDPMPAIRGRAEYQVWFAALGELCADLAPRLTTVRLEPTPRPEKPWIEGDWAPSVLPDLSDMRWP